MLPSDLCRSGNAGLIARPSASVKKCSALCARNRNGRCCEIRIGQRMVGGQGDVALLVKSPGAVANTPMVTHPSSLHKLRFPLRLTGGLCLAGHRFATPPLACSGSSRPPAAFTLHAPCHTLSMERAVNPNCDRPSLRRRQILREKSLKSRIGRKSVIDR